ncbi:MAG: nucleotidyltransferase family protein [Pseudomonadota bacterium]
MTGRPETAMVLAAGLGTRMRPLTDDRPKPLIEVAGKALIDYALDRFVDAGVKRAIVNVHYLADMMERHVLDRTSPEIMISDERSLLLETGGGLKKAAEHFDDGPIFCTNTDAILIDGDGAEACARLSEAWRDDAMDALLLLVPIARTSGYDGAGDFHRDEDGRIAFRSGDRAPLVFTGLQLIAPRLLDGAPDGPFSTKRLWDKALGEGRLHGVIHDGDWMHVGDPQGLEDAERRLRDARDRP